jgi:hypothetical protein
MGVEAGGGWHAILNDDLGCEIILQTFRTDLVYLARAA